MWNYLSHSLNNRALTCCTCGPCGLLPVFWTSFVCTFSSQLLIIEVTGCLPQIPPVTIFIWLRNFKIFIFWTLDKRECWSLMVSTCRWFDINERFPQLSCYVHVCFLTWSWFYKLSWTCIGLIIIKIFNSPLDKKKKRGWSFKLVMFSE